MANKNFAVFGIFGDTAALHQGLETLRAAGFRNTDVSLLMPENLGTKDLAHKKETKAPEGATTGGVTGGVLGGALGWLVGIGALAIPGLGPFIAAGPIMGMLAGAGAGGTVGGIVGSLVGAGIPEYEAKRYEGRVKTGGILFSVHCDDSEWTKRAKKDSGGNGCRKHFLHWRSCGRLCNERPSSLSHLASCNVYLGSHSLGREMGRWCTLIRAANRS